MLVGILCKVFYETPKEEMKDGKWLVWVFLPFSKSNSSYLLPKSSVHLCGDEVNHSPLSLGCYVLKLRRGIHPKELGWGGEEIECVVRQTVSVWLAGGEHMGGVEYGKWYGPVSVPRA